MEFGELAAVVVAVASLLFSAATWLGKKSAEQLLIERLERLKAELQRDNLVGIEQEKAALQAGLEQAKAVLSSQAIEHAKRSGHFFEKGAEAVDRINTALYELEVSLFTLTSPMRAVSEPPVPNAEQFNNALTSAKAIRDLIEHSRLYLPQATTEDLEKLMDVANTIFGKIRLYLAMAGAPDKQSQVFALESWSTAHKLTEDTLRTARLGLVDQMQQVIVGQRLSARPQRAEVIRELEARAQALAEPREPKVLSPGGDEEG